MKKFRQKVNWEAILIIVLMLAIFTGLFFYVLDTAEDADNAARDAQVAVDDAANALKQSDRERIERTDQACELFERLHHRDVVEYKREIRSVKLTANYIKGLTPKQRQSPINKVFITQVPRGEAEYRKERREALIDIAPDYCDEPGVKAEKKGADPVGLPEPDPKIPEGIKRLNPDGS